MKNVIIFQSRIEPYFHDRLIDFLFLWMFPSWIRPNHITAFRLITTPPVLALIVFEAWRLAIPAFILVAFTDALDGSMARIRRQITAWGTFFDPLADKILIGGALFILILKYINIYIGAAIIFLELVVILGGWLKRKKGMVVSANFWGKIKMFCQAVGVSLLLISLFIGASAIMFLAEIILIISIIFAIFNILSHRMAL